jgi:ligand-binding sensor domain-containing protein
MSKPGTCFFRKLLFFLLAMTVYTGIVNGQEQTVIKRLGISNGLSNNSVRCIYQDKRGFIWLATYDGLNRYDGREFKVFRNKIGDSTSLPHNYIYTLYEDADQQFWVGTGRGLAIFNHSLQRFAPVYFYRYTSTVAEKVEISVNSIQGDATGNMYIGTSGWGLLTRKSGEKICRTIPLANGTTLTADYNVSGIVVEGASVWVFVGGQGLAVFDATTQSLRIVNPEIRFANCLFADTAGEIWVGAESGLYQFSTVQKKYTLHLSDKAGQLNDHNVTSIGADGHQQLWIGTDRGGISVYNRETRQFRYIESGDGSDKLSSETVSSILKDKESRIWIGTIKGGCNIIDVQKGRFTSISRQPFSREHAAGKYGVFLL